MPSGGNNKTPLSINPEQIQGLRAGIAERLILEMHVFKWFF